MQRRSFFGSALAWLLALVGVKVASANPDIQQANLAAKIKSDADRLAIEISRRLMPEIEKALADLPQKIEAALRAKLNAQVRRERDAAPVYLKSGGPPMQVAMRSPDGRVLCRWTNSRGNLEEADFAEESLTVIRPS